MTEPEPLALGDAVTKVAVPEATPEIVVTGVTVRTSVPLVATKVNVLVSIAVGTTAPVPEPEAPPAPPAPYIVVREVVTKVEPPLVTVATTSDVVTGVDAAPPEP